MRQFRRSSHCCDVHWLASMWIVVMSMRTTRNKLISRVAISATPTQRWCPCSQKTTTLVSERMRPMTSRTNGSQCGCRHNRCCVSIQVPQGPPRWSASGSLKLLVSMAFERKSRLCLRSCLPKCPCKPSVITKQWCRRRSRTSIGCNTGGTTASRTTPPTTSRERDRERW